MTIANKAKIRYQQKKTLLQYNIHDYTCICTTRKYLDQDFNSVFKKKNSIEYMLTFVIQYCKEIFK